MNHHHLPLSSVAIFAQPLAVRSLRRSFLHALQCILRASLCCLMAKKLALVPSTLKRMLKMLKILKPNGSATI